MSSKDSSTAGGALRSSPRYWTAPLLLGLFCFLVYNANLRQIGAGDTFPARYQPLILWRDGTLALDENARLAAHGHSMLPGWNRPAGAEGQVTYFESWTYWIVLTRRHHHHASLYPVVTPLLVAPLYVPAVIWLNAHGWEQPRVGRVAELMEKLSASLVASLACVLMFLVLRREGNRWSLPLALAFAFGTNTWMTSSQALWQHGTGELLIALTLLLILAPASALRTALVGASCVLMAANRPPDALVAGAFILFTIWSRRRGALWLFAGAAVPLAALLYYNLNLIGHYAGGYALGKPPKQPFFNLSLSGIAGLLVSPTRGLLVFSPFLLFVPVGLIQRLRAPHTRGLAVALSLALAAQLLLYSQADWRAGVSWGPRWLTDVLPILLWMLAPAPLLLRPRARGLLVAAMAASIVVQVIGAFWYTKTSDEVILASQASMRAAWDPRNVPFLTELRHPRARGELQCDASGALEQVGPTKLQDKGEAPALEHGALLEGWALTCGRTPSELLLLIDGIVVGSTRDFLPHAGVNSAMHAGSAAGWRITANMRGISPGERVLQLAVRIEPRSDIRIALERSVSVIAQEPPSVSAGLPEQLASGPELEILAERAASLLREQQNAEGFWFTSHTKKLRYAAPQPEMNTFLTSMLIDLLAPIARRRNLDGALERARRHLAAQIESDGLVRYHGLPNSPIIGRLGCAITPDADDTALVWRIANPGPDDPRRTSMLRELARYRDARGLYLTWLAPQGRYQCIDPGRDPNPSDIAIQMHVYQMLRELDPPAARELCSALRRSYWDGDIWNYYAKAPLVPYLRSVELRQLGCALPPPAERLALPAAGQEVWHEAAHLLARTTESPTDANTRQAIHKLLAYIGKDDFAHLRRSPPLLYHNDLSASVSRYYWSEEFGYALWLRLHEAAGMEDGQLSQLSQ